MDVNKLRDWAKKMGYQGKIPDDDKQVFNASTAHIWEQIVARIRPKNEVNTVRQNIAIQKLENKIENATTTVLDCPNKEVDLWIERQQLEESVEKGKVKIREVKRQMKHLETEGSILTAEIQHLDTKIQELDSTEYLYRKKCVDFGKDLRVLEGKRDEITKLASITGNLNKCNSADFYDFTERLSCFMDKEHADIKELYGESSREDLWECIRTKEDGLMNDIRQTIEKEITSRKDIESELAALNEANTAKLHMVHIENELEAMKLEKQHNKLQKSLIRIRNQVIDKWKVTIPDIEGVIDEEMKSIALKAAYKVYEAEIPQLNERIHLTSAQFSSNEYKLQLRQARNNLSIKSQSLSTYLENIMKTESKIQEHRHEVQTMLELLGNFASRNPAFTKPLTNRWFSNEINLFEQFHLENNRQLTYICENKGVSRLYRDMSNCRLPFGNGQLDDDVLRSVVSSLGVPVTETNELLEYFINKRLRLEQMMKLSCFFDEIDTSCDIKQFDSEIVDEKMLDELRAAAANTWTPMVTQMKESLRLWEEMPFNNYLSGEITHKGHEYKYYEELYMEYFSQVDVKM